MDTQLKYEWQQAVLDAFLELAPEGLPQKVGAAQKKITERLLDQQGPDQRERAALNDALHLLLVIFPARVIASPPEEGENERPRL